MNTKQKYQAACRLQRITVGLWMKMRGENPYTPEYRALDEARERYKTALHMLGFGMVLDSAISDKPIYTEYMNNLGNWENLARVDGTFHNIGGKYFIFMDGKFVPYQTDEDLAKAS